jgi:hypothetical protein
LWPGNWKPKDLTCSGSQLSIVWNRTEHGWIEHLHKIQPKAMIIGDGSIATLSAPLKLPPGEDEAAPREDVRTVAMYAAAQKYGFKLQLTPVPPPPPPPQEGGEPPPMPDWREIKWSVQATELPYFVVIGALESEGFRISQLKKVFTEGKSTWTLEGTQYVQL